MTGFVVWSVSPGVHLVVKLPDVRNALRETRDLVRQTGYPTLPQRATVVDFDHGETEIVTEVVSAFSHEEVIGWVLKGGSPDDE